MTIDFLLGVSALGLLILGFVGWRRGLGGVGLLLAAIGVLGTFVLWRLGLFQFFWVPSPTPKSGDASPTGSLIALYVSTVAGMLAHFAFDRFQRPRRRRRKFDWGNMIAPVFASPMVFLPLATVFHQLGADLEMASSSRNLLLLVAFENGFFWKEFMENRWKAKTET